MPDSVGPGRTGPDGANKGRSVPNRAGQDLAWSTESDRGGKCSVKAVQGQQDRVDPGWVGHGRIGRVGRDRAGSCKVGHGRVGSDSGGQGLTGQRQAGWIRTAPARTGQSRAGSRSTGQDREMPEGSVSAGLIWARPNRAWYVQQNRPALPAPVRFC